MNIAQIKKQLSEKGTPVSDFQAEQIAAKISGFCDEMKVATPRWTGILRYNKLEQILFPLNSAIVQLYI